MIIALLVLILIAILFPKTLRFLILVLLFGFLWIVAHSVDKVEQEKAEQTGPATKP